MSFVLLGILNSQAAAGGVEPPAFLSSAPLWLDASDASTISESGGSVSQWDNKGTLENFTQATSASQPTTGVTTLNGLNVIDFASDFMSGSTKSQWKFMHDGTDYFFAYVVKQSHSGTTICHFGTNATDGSNIGMNHRTSATNGIRFDVTMGNGSLRVLNINDTGILTNNTFAIASGLYDLDNGTASDRLSYYVNNTQGTVTNSETTAPSSSDPTYNLEIGASGNAFLPLTGSIAEFIIVSGADATETNRQEVVDYLNAKWSIF